MPTFDKAEISKQAALYSFQRDTFEKVLRLKRILEYMQGESLLRDHLLLKGGTAINLTVFEMPRLSVDIDLDYVPNDSREVMMQRRQEIDSVIRAYMEDEGYQISNDSRYHHSLDAYHFRFRNSSGNPDMIKIEINYSLRAHLLESEERRIRTDALGEPVSIRTVHPLEVFAAKANALLSRAAARDLYDFDNMIRADLFSTKDDLFRKAIILYASISSEKINKSFDTSRIDGLTFRKIRRDLFPVLKREEVHRHFDILEYQKRAKDYFQEIMQLTEEEKKYLEEFEQGRYRPELLFDDSEIISRIDSHPMALWKCSNKG